MNIFKILDKQELRGKHEKENGNASYFDIGFPLFEISDSLIEEIYYFRWSVYAKHIKSTEEGYVITEFLPNVPWAGRHNTISCAASHHFNEGRWLHDGKILSDYARFWLSPGAEPRKYSFPLAASVYAFCEVKGDFSLCLELYDGLCENYLEWERSHERESGLFWQNDNRDGMELSISGNGLRPTINSYMYADAEALSRIASLKGLMNDSALYKSKAERLRALINENLWDSEAEFYKNLSEDLGYKKADVRELIGYVPWCYSIPEPNYSSAWRFLFDENHFDAPYGPTTAERCHPRFMEKHDHECLWNGPSWPYATSQVLSAMINLIHNYEQSTVTKKDFYSLLTKYAASHFIEKDGKKTTFVDENLDPFTGRWLARDILMSKTPPRSDQKRGENYNHSSFSDLIIRGIAGITVSDGTVSADPIIDTDRVDYFCLDGIYIAGSYYTVIYDKHGTRYGRGKGLTILQD